MTTGKSNQNRNKCKNDHDRHGHKHLNAEETNSLDSESQYSDEFN